MRPAWICTIIIYTYRPGNTTMRITKSIIIPLILLLSCCICAACGEVSEEKSAGANAKEIHVSIEGSDESGDGSIEKPFATPARAAEAIGPGATVIIHSGEYDPFRLGKEASGTKEAPVTVRAADGETVIINGRTPDDDDQEIHDIEMEDVSNITIENLELQAGTHGIAYFTTKENGGDPIGNVTISGCTVHGVRGIHGICVYAQDPKAPLTGLVIRDNEVFDCECGDSESVVVNGNIDGFEIDGNVIHDNNNIGIDMIGFEGTAKADSHDKDPFASDFVRNGKCHGNTVYNISSEENDAYLEDGEYDLCADGIYVDGGQDIVIYENYICNCDIGIEVATEHSPKDSDLFKVSGIEVHDNVIRGCKGWCGLAIGGYDKDLGFTEGCGFTNNTFIENGTQIGIQRSKDNVIENNLFVGGDASIEFNGDCREKDMANDFGENTWVIDKSTFEETCDLAGYDPAVLFPDDGLKKQIVNDDKESVIDGMRSLVKGTGSSFVPDASAIKRADRD